MNLEYSNRRDLVAQCPKCKRSTLSLITAKAGFKTRDFLACSSCKFYMFIDEFKESLFRE